jgi:hypothetical protein
MIRLGSAIAVRQGRSPFANARRGIPDNLFPRAPSAGVLARRPYGAPAFAAGMRFARLHAGEPARVERTPFSDWSIAGRPLVGAGPKHAGDEQVGVDRLRQEICESQTIGLLSRVG